jgi:YcxB-like protein
MMTVSYKNTFKDLAWFLLHCSLRLRHLIIMFIAPVLLTLHVMHKLPEESPVYISVMLFLTFTSFLFVIVFVLSFCVNLLLMISKSNKTFLCEHTFTADEEKLTEETEFNHSEHYWKGITKITKTRNYIYLFISRNMAHVIPVKAFKEAGEAEEFTGFCKRMKSKATL